MIVRQFRLLLIAKEHGLRGGSAGELAKVAGVAGFVAQSLARQARDFSLDDLERIYHSLAETDFKMKTGQIDPELALDLFITSVAR
jgi:DNA polymerase-3 subunit delta